MRSPVIVQEERAPFPRKMQRENVIRSIIVKGSLGGRNFRTETAFENIVIIPINRRLVYFEGNGMSIKDGSGGCTKGKLVL